MLDSGIYLLRIAGQRYVGSSSDVYRRWQEHIRKMRAGCHENARIQHAFDGTKKASFEILERVEAENLLTREEYWIRTIKPELNANVESTHAGRSVYLMNPVKFVHRSHGTRRVTNVAAFAESIGVAPCSVSNVINGKRQSIKGWRLVKENAHGYSMPQIAQRPEEETF